MSELQLPAWIRERKLRLGDLHEVRAVVQRERLHTVCDEARCPNRSECFSRGTATFLVMGDTCTRSCRYCSIAHGRPGGLDPDEPENVARAAVEMGLRHVVVTSVDRDDLPDGGAGHFAEVVSALGRLHPRPTIEVLTPDFRGDLGAVDAVLQAGPDVFNHNVETVRRLYSAVRRSGRYEWALDVLRHVAGRCASMVTKSGIMVGLGEKVSEVHETLRDLDRVGCRIVTIGQYLRPTRRQVTVQRYWRPEEFIALEDYGRSLGLEVVAGPFVRSSYHAEEAFLRAARGAPPPGPDSGSW
jgi:lipoic acid synthetase